MKIFRSPQYNYVFDGKTGFFARWGETQNDDPVYSPFGPEILDLEISAGRCAGNCPECYKANGPGNAVHMTMPTFKALLDKFKLGDKYFLTQIAFGITDTGSNPDFWRILEYSRNEGIIPNYTTHGFDVTPGIAQRTKELCGAVAVSYHKHNACLHAVREFIRAGCPQVNIHFILYRNSVKRAFKLIDAVKDIDGVNAVVFLRYKPKGRNAGEFAQCTPDQLRSLYNYAVDNGVGIGFDSCNAPYVLRYCGLSKGQEQFVEPCESGLFSSYINVHGEFFPCSFCEGEPGWETGIPVLDYDNFLDVWHSDKVKKWRRLLLDNCRECILFDLEGEKNDENQNGFCV